MPEQKPRSTKIDLPFPPSVNHYWGNRVIIPRGGGKPFVQTFIGAKGKAYRADVGAAVWERWGTLKPLDFPLRLLIVAHPPDRRKRDLDNLLKAALDALDHSNVYEDDSIIHDLRISLGDVQKPGRLEVTIEELT